MNQEIAVSMAHRLAGGILQAGNPMDLVNSVTLCANRLADTLCLLAEFCEMQDQANLSATLYGLALDAEDIKAIANAWHSASQAGRENAET